MHWYNKWILFNLYIMFYMSMFMLTCVAVYNNSRHVTVYSSVIFLSTRYCTADFFYIFTPPLSVYFLQLIICTFKAKSIKSLIKTSNVSSYKTSFQQVSDIVFYCKFQLWLNLLHDHLESIQTLNTELSK